MSDIEDRRIIEQVLEGDVHKYSILINKYKRMVYSIAYKILKNREDAEDTSQDIFIKVYNSLKIFGSSAKFSTWLYKISFNMTISKARKKKISISPIELNEDISPDYSETNLGLDNLIRQERKQILEQALSELNELEYLLIILYYYEEKTIEEISEISNLSKSNIKTILFRTRKKLFTVITRLSSTNAEYLI